MTSRENTISSIKSVILSCDEVVETSSVNYFLLEISQRMSHHLHENHRQTTLPVSMTSESDLLLCNRGLIWNQFSVMADENIVILER